VDETTRAILERVDALAAQLGGTTTELWPLLVHGTFMAALIGVLLGVFILLAMGTLGWIMWRAGAPEKDYPRDGDNGYNIVATILWVVGAVAGIGIIAGHFYPLCVPEMVVLRDLLHGLPG
jgi:hypothetical protein